MVINRRLFRLIQKAILADPSNFFMQSWAAPVYRKYGPVCETEFLWSDHQLAEFTRIVGDREPCGTACCIAGHGLLLSGYTTTLRPSAFGCDPVREARFLTPKRRLVKNPGVSAARLLGITESQADAIFSVGEWPPRFQDRWNRAKRPQTRAKVAATVIDAFLANPKQFVLESRAQ